MVQASAVTWGARPFGARVLVAGGSEGLPQSRPSFPGRAEGPSTLGTVEGRLNPFLIDKIHHGFTLVFLVTIQGDGL